jgi:rod shape-determining protein MreC
LSHSNDSWNQIITIDKGANDGIGAGMPVMSANGLLGQVETTGPFTSTVRLITDPSSGVSVFLQASRKEGILTGSPERLLYLSYMSVDSQVEPGDVVITSGAGGIYPKGIVIGEVVSATHSVTDVYQTVVVKPVSRVESYEEVVVLTGRATEVATPTFGGSSSGGSSTSGNASGDSTSGSSAAGATGDITSDTAGTGTTAEVGATGDTGTGTLASTGGGG